jgi:hypothetical protein
MSNEQASKEFDIFYSKSNDALGVVRTYHKIASDHAKETKKDVAVSDIDVDTATDDQKKYWSGTATIECAAVAGDKIVDHDVNPSEQRIDEMIDKL